MKILLINKFHYLRAGAETYYFSIADAFKNNGDEVVYFAMQDDRNFPCEQEKFFVKNATTEGGLLSKLKMVANMSYSKEAYKKLTLLLQQEKPDLVIINLIHKHLTCSVIDAIRDYDKKLPIFWVMHDLITVCPAYTMLNGKGEICEECFDKDFKHCIKNKCVRSSRLLSRMSAKEAENIKKHGWYDKVDLYICPSEFYKKKLEEAKFTKSEITAIRNPLSTDMEYCVSDKDEGYILFFGRLAKEKGVRVLIDAVKNKNCKLVVLGNGPEEVNLKKYVETENIVNVEFGGFKGGEELASYVKNSRCVVLPSIWYENCPYSAMEAMAYGKPLIVSNLGGLPELVDDKNNGYVYSTEEELSEVIDKMLCLSEEEYTKMCIYSTEKAKRDFDPQEYVKRIKKEAERFIDKVGK